MKRLRLFLASLALVLSCGVANASYFYNHCSTNGPNGTMSINCWSGNTSAADASDGPGVNGYWVSIMTTCYIDLGSDYTNPNFYHSAMMSMWVGGYAQIYNFGPINTYPPIYIHILTCGIYYWHSGQAKDHAPQGFGVGDTDEQSSRIDHRTYCGT
ncbi:MAG TPA: hypothetical protein VEZ88_13450 [Steroidobacteraceae bacterium]|nr:hypothetical protein [Steroidobacteraceae bacterium]